VPLPTTSALLRDAQAARGGVLVAADSSAIVGSSALPRIHLTAARDGRRCWKGHVL
jgi:hypothetical protein